MLFRNLTRTPKVPVTLKLIVPWEVVSSGPSQTTQHHRTRLPFKSYKPR